MSSLSQFYPHATEIYTTIIKAMHIQRDPSSCCSSTTTLPSFNFNTHTEH